ncbi:MAG TPA: diguanylate cyclase [Acidimicrobiia bacterium]|nr:diguanylate cyclase [Acidimicrobiia bacterium]
MSTVAGANVAAGLAAVALWFLREWHVVSPRAPFPILVGLVGLAILVDGLARVYHARRPASRAREQVRLCSAALTTTAVLYTVGWGSMFAIGYALCAVQLLAQLRRVDWRAAYGWCLLGVAVGEIAVARGVAPSMIALPLAHAVALTGLGILGATLWIVSGAFAARDAVEAELAAEAATDPLTTLANRSAFTAELEEAAQRGLPLVLAFVDLNDFKDINDTFGHHVGDEMLVEVGRRLRSIARPFDVAARIGGDEFVVLVRPEKPMEGATLVERIQSVLEAPWPAIAPSMITASIGIVEDRSGTRTPDDLLREADQAMYARKHGMRSDATVPVLMSRGLAHYRAAMDGLRGSFSVLRAVRQDDAIIDWEILEANALLRNEYEDACGDIVGLRFSALQRFAPNGALTEVYLQACSTGKPVEKEMEIHRVRAAPVWTSVVVVPVEPDVVAVVVRDIREQKAQRDALSGERARFASLLAGSAALACVVDDAGSIIFRPPWGTTFLGYSIDDLPAPLGIVADRDRARAEAWFDSVRALTPGERSVSITLCLRASDGTLRTCDLSALDCRNDPHVAGIVLNVHEISDLVAAETRLAALAENMSDIVAICAPDGEVTWISGAVRAALGYEPEEIAGSNAFALMHPDDRDHVATRLAEVVADPNEDGPLVQLRLRHADGSHRWFEVDGTNKLDEPVLNGVVVCLRDIAERRAADEALRASELRNRAIVEAAADAIVTVDHAGIVQTFNRSAERIFGLRADEIVGGSYAQFLTDGSLETLRTAMTSSRPGTQIEVVARRASGEEFFAQVALSRMMIDGLPLFTAMVRDVTHQYELEQRLRTAALFDELTGLPNRRMLLDHVEAAIGRVAGTGEPCNLALLFIDLDRFKLVNDALGHDVGDEVLVLVAERISAATRRSDLVARMGADEFVVLCEDAGSIEEISARAKYIAETLEPCFDVGGAGMFVSASIGVAIWQEGETPLDLLRSADTAMYRAKARGRSQLELFDAHMHDEVAARLEFESALRRGIDRDELEVHYQPIIDLGTIQISGFEALVRWNRPGYGLVSPNDFIPAAEAAGLVVPIGEWVLARAAEDCASWQDIAPGVGVSVNVSVRQFDAGDLVNVMSRDIGKL